MSQWNTLSVPLENGWQCTLVPTSDYRTQSGNWLIFGTDDEREEIKQARRDFDRYFRPRSDMRTVSGGAELREIQSFLRDTLNVVHRNLPSDNAGVERMLREAVADGRLVPVLNHGYAYSCRVSRPTPAPLRWPSYGGGGMVRATSYGSSWASSSSALFDGEPILSGPYDPATQAARLSAARGAIAASGNGGNLLGLLETVAGAALSTGSGADDGGDEVADDGVFTFTSLGDTQPFEYTENTVSGDTEELAASTNNPKFAAKMLSYDYKTFGTMLHKFKDANGLGPADNSIFHDNGDMEFNGRIFEDSIHDYAP
ncbi:hypothetical protein HHL24_10670 [Paraburkholderia sp. RP-4-7]|uniref:Uncharacterized protein n=1 Tax=Paraburkholderia polaris TaxID=2728848 RepID=A0A848IEH8_9BURK|nr:hypothetical protein [Paraburkholderia polaris]NML98414.1 hypothetical protein [Paraburkholderia polaris]